MEGAAHMWKWIREHGAKVLSGLLTALTATNGADPALLPSFVGEDGDRWLQFALAVAALGHATLVTGRPGNPDTPPSQKQGGNIRAGMLAALLLTAFGALAAIGAFDLGSALVSGYVQVRTEIPSCGSAPQPQPAEPDGPTRVATP